MAGPASACCTDYRQKTKNQIWAHLLALPESWQKPLGDSSESLEGHWMTADLTKSGTNNGTVEFVSGLQCFCLPPPDQHPALQLDWSSQPACRCERVNACPLCDGPFPFHSFYSCCLLVSITANVPFISFFLIFLDEKMFFFKIILSTFPYFYYLYCVCKYPQLKETSFPIQLISFSEFHSFTLKVTLNPGCWEN